MKKILLVFLALALLLTACAQQKATETAAPEAPAEIPTETPVVETPAAETPAAPIETPTETPVALTPAAPAEAPKAQTDEQIFEVKEGDTIAYKEKSIIVEEIANSGNYMTLKFDDFRFHLYAVNKPEILNNIEYQIVENNFNTKNSVKLRVKTVKLEKDEYMLETRGSVTVNNKRFMLGNVQQDNRGDESAYFLIGDNEYWAKVGDTVNANGLSVTLLKAFFKQRQYAILKIVPA